MESSVRNLAKSSQWGNPAKSQRGKRPAEPVAPPPGGPIAKKKETTIKSDRLAELSESDYFYLSFGKKVMSEDVRQRLMGRDAKKQLELDPTAPIPTHKGKIGDLFKWFDDLDYDPRSLKDRKEQKRLEKEEEEKSKANAAEGMMQQKLIGLSSVMRAEMIIFVDYLLDFGSRHTSTATESSKQLANLGGQDESEDPENMFTSDGEGTHNPKRRGSLARPDMTRRSSKLGNSGRESKAPTSNSQTDAKAMQRLVEEGVLPSSQMYMQLRDCFEILDLDTSGTITMDELRRASYALDKSDSADKAFKNLDQNRSGSIDFLEMLRVFFPKATLRQLLKVNSMFGKPYEKYPGGMIPARDRLLPKDLAEIDSQFEKVCRLEEERKHRPVVHAAPTPTAGGGFRFDQMQLSMTMDDPYQELEHTTSSVAPSPSHRRSVSPSLSVSGQTPSPRSVSPRMAGGGGGQRPSPRKNPNVVVPSSEGTESTGLPSRSGAIGKTHPKTGVSFATGVSHGGRKNKSQHPNRHNTTAQTVMSIAHMKISVEALIESLKLEDRAQWVRGLFANYDLDKDGKINLDEFTEMFKYSYPPFCGTQPGDDEAMSLAWLTKRRDKDPSSFRLPTLKTYVPQVSPNLLKHAKAPPPLDEDPKAKRRRLAREQEQSENAQSKGAALQAATPSIASPRILACLSPTWQDRVCHAGDDDSGKTKAKPRPTSITSPTTSRRNTEVDPNALSRSNNFGIESLAGVQISDDFRYLLQSGIKRSGSKGAGHSRPVTVDSLQETGRPLFFSSAFAEYSTPRPPSVDSPAQNQSPLSRSRGMLSSQEYE